MKLDLVDAMTETIVRSQHRTRFVGEKPPANDLFAAGARAQGRDRRLRPRRAFAAHAFDQGTIDFERVVVL
jgi:hypothetical protein